MVGFVVFAMVCRMDDAQQFLRPYTEPHRELSQFQTVSSASKCTLQRT